MSRTDCILQQNIVIFICGLKAYYRQMSQDFVFIVKFWNIFLEDQEKNDYQNVWKQWLNMEMVE